MTNHFNDLTEPELERLAILAEECSEVIQIVGKILRHGYTSTHPDNDDGPDNRDMLEMELGHVMAIRKMMEKHQDIYREEIQASAMSKSKRIKQYLHHQS